MQTSNVDAARAVVRGMPVRRPGLDLRPAARTADPLCPYCEMPDSEHGDQGFCPPVTPTGTEHWL